MGKSASKEHRESKESQSFKAANTKYSRDRKRKQYLKRIKRDRKQQHVSKEQMARLSMEMSRTAWYLGRRLGFTEGEVRKVLWREADEQSARYRLLMTWRKRAGWRATNQNLVILLELAGYTSEEYRSILSTQDNGHVDIYDKAAKSKSNASQKQNGFFRYDNLEKSTNGGYQGDKDHAEKKRSSVNSNDDVIEFARRSWKKPSKRRSDKTTNDQNNLSLSKVKKTFKEAGRGGGLADPAIPHSAREPSSSAKSNLHIRRYSDSTLNHVIDWSSKYNSESELNAIFSPREQEDGIFLDQEAFAKTEEGGNLNDAPSHLYREELMRVSNRQFHNTAREYSSSSYSYTKFPIQGAGLSDQQISGLAVTDDNRIVVAESSAKEIQIFDQFGAFLNSFPTRSELNPKGVGINQDGDIAVCCGKEVRVLTTEGELVGGFGRGSFRNNCYSVECDASGVYYVTDIVGHCVSVFDVDGQIRKRFGHFGEKLDNFNQPVALAINDRNRLFISDSQNHCVKVYSLAGRPLEKIGEKGNGNGMFWNPFGLCFDRRGRLLVADCGNNRISQFDGNFKFTRHILTEKNGLEMPSFIRVNSDGQLVVCEWKSPFVKVYSFESAV